MVLSGIGAGSAQVIDSVSSNSYFEFDGINITDGLDKFRDFWDNMVNYLPGFQRVGLVLNNVFSAFPPKFWFCMIICVICLTIGRILRRY